MCTNITWTHKHAYFLMQFLVLLESIVLSVANQRESFFFYNNTIAIAIAWFFLLSFLFFFFASFIWIHSYIYWTKIMLFLGQNKMAHNVDNLIINPILNLMCHFLLPKRHRFSFSSINIWMYSYKRIKDIQNCLGAKFEAKITKLGKLQYFDGKSF